MRPSWQRRCGIVVIGAVFAHSGCTATLPFDELTGKPPRPAARFDFEEGAGAIAFGGATYAASLDDFSGKPPTWTRAGRHGGGVEFPAGDGWLSLSDFSAARFPQQGTLAAWVRLKTFLQGDSTDIFTAEEDDTDSGDDEGHVPLAAFIENGVLTFGIYTQVSGQCCELVTPAVDLNTWLLIVVGWDVPKNRAVLFLRTEGKPDPPVQWTALPSGFKLDAPFLMAGAGQGVMDELRIWTQLLSDDDIRKLE